MKRIGLIGILAGAALLAGCIMFPPKKPAPQLASPPPAQVLRDHPPQDTLAPPTAAETATTETPAPVEGANACHADQFQNLIGKTITSVDQSTLPPHHRVICMGCMATMDFVADRLTIQLGPNQTIASLRCG